MKLSCPRNVLLAAFGIVSAVAPQRSPKEILRNVKLTLEHGKATLLGTDEEIGIRYELTGVETSSVGEVLLPTQRTGAILREAQDDVIQLEAIDNALWIRTHQSEFRLNVEDPAQFPDVPTFEDQDYYVIHGKALKQGIQRTIIATDPESSRYALGGVLIDIDPEHFTLAATDGRRLATYRAACSRHGQPGEESAEPVVPEKAMSLIERTIHDDDQEVQLAIHSHHVLVRSGLSTIYARLVEGRFPKYQDVIPKEFRSTVDFVVGPFLSAIRQAQIVTNEESRGVDFTFNDGTLTLNSVGQDVGTSRIQIPVAYDSEQLAITFDPSFIQQFLRVLDSAGSVTLNIVDQNSAAVFKADENYTYVVMPLARD